MIGMCPTQHGRMFMPSVCCPLRRTFALGHLIQRLEAFSGSWVWGFYGEMAKVIGGLLPAFGEDANHGLYLRHRFDLKSDCFNVDVV